MSATVTRNLTKACADLRRQGYFARSRPIACCQSCGWAEVERHGKRDKAIFYHAQDADLLKETGELWLAWSGDGAEIVEALEKRGLDAEWDGDDATRILVREA